jgi:N-acyl-D-aspartate/D-glutamate deacylase
MNVDDESMQALLRLPGVMIGSDSVPVKPGWSAHPRNFGSFPRLIRKYVNETHCLTLEEAVFKMSGQAASRFRMRDRGLLKEGFKADVLVFDSDRVNDTASLDDPMRRAEGMDFVFVNGVLAVDGGKSTGNPGGRALKRVE